MTSLRSLRGDLIASHRPKVRSTFDTAMGQNLNPWMASDDGDSITGGWRIVSVSVSLMGVWHSVPDSDSFAGRWRSVSNPTLFSVQMMASWVTRGHNIT